MYKTRFGGRSPHGQERRLKPQPFLCAASQNTAGKVGSECCPLGTSREGQWLRLCTFAAGGTGSIPGWGTKTLPATRHGQENRNTRTNQKVCCLLTQTCCPRWLLWVGTRSQEMQDELLFDFIFRHFIEV